MKLPISWLSEFVDIKGIELNELADKLVNIGFEVEEIIRFDKEITNVFTGRITSIDKHENADKLLVCNTDLGELGTKQIVTGAKNLTVGDVVPVAVDCAVLPIGLKINNTALRGVMSYGMYCSGEELMVTDDIVEGASVDGILILDKKTPLGVDVKTVLGLDEVVFDISVTANRPDCNSVYGMAREIAAVLNKKLKPLNLSYKTVKSDREPVAVEIEADSCSRYTGRIIQNLKVKPSADIIAKRLRQLGLKPINNIVDITNYVLLEVGQPLHAFDINLIDKKIVVKNAKQGEKLKLLNGDEVVLTDTMLTIADSVKPLALAGIMGGEFSGITDGTKTVFLEAAQFARGAVRSTARKLGISSDSSKRFEKGVDYQSIDVGRERALALIYENKVGDITDIKCDNNKVTKKKSAVKFKLTDIEKILGIKVPLKQVVSILTALEFEVAQKDDTITAKVPLFRDDIDGIPDIAEEVIRFYGYDNIVPTMFEGGKTQVGGFSEKAKNIQTLKQLLVGSGANEIITYSFISEKQNAKLNINADDELNKMIEILNPLSSEFKVLRRQIIGGMLNAVKLNLSRKNDNFRLFEIAKVYNPNELPLADLPNEDSMLAIAFVGKAEDFYSLKAVAGAVLDKFKISYDLKHSLDSWLHPGISADIISKRYGKLGSFGQVHPTVLKNFDIDKTVFLLQLNIQPFISAPIQNVTFKNLPKYPAVQRDLALVVNENVLVGDMMRCIKSNANSLCEEVKLFDIYTGQQIEKGFKSVAFSLSLRSQDKTLCEQEIGTVMQKIIDSLRLKFNAKLRD